MAVFKYKALDARSQMVTGTLVADTPRQAREQLYDRGMTVQDVAQHGSARGQIAQPGQSFLRIRRSYAARNIELIRDLSTLLGVGVPLLDALQTLGAQQSGGFRGVVLHLQDRIAAGSSLAQAMRDHPDIFDRLDVSVIEVGETAGTLETVLNRLAEFKENRAAVRGRIGTALLYPAIVFCVAIGVSLLLMTFVVPKLLGSLIEAGRPIPLVTRIVKGMSDAILNGWWVGLGLVVIATVAIGYFLSTQRGRAAWDRLQLRIPIVGPALRKQAIARMAVVMATLMRNGIVFLKAVQIARETTTNSVLRDALAKCEIAVGAGTDLAAAVGDTGAFPPMVIQMFAIGQQSGKLEEMLERLATDYERQVRSLTNRLTTILEPVLILFMVIVVGFIAFATLLPMLEAADVF
jgi:general secretion pathway protein F